PLPVLGASLLFALGGAYCVLFGFTVPMFPFFGRNLTGVASWAVMFVLGIVDIVIAVNLYRLKVAAWWGAVALAVFRAGCSIIVFARGDVFRAYAGAGMTEQQLQMFRSNPMFRGHFMLWWSLAWILATLAYLVWLKRYFQTPETPAQVQPALSI